MTYEEFLVKIYQETKEYPMGLPKERQRKWEDISDEEKEHWNTFASNPSMRVYSLALEAFKMKTEKGFPEELFEANFGLLGEDSKNFRKHLGHFMERHKEISRQSAAKKFKT